MAKIRYPKANSLRVIRLEDYDLLQSDDTRLYYDFNYQTLVNDCYFTKILYTDNIWLQFRTDYQNVSAYLIAKDTGAEVNITSSISPGITNPNGTIQHELALSTLALSGYYYIRFDFDQDRNNPIATYQTEWFEIITDTTDLLNIKWYNSDFNTYNDGIIWSQPQSIWVSSRISDLLVGVENSQFTTENGKLKTTQARPIKSKKWELELVPDYVLELFNLYMQTGKFYINEVRYNAESSFEEQERLGDTRLYPLVVTLRMVEDHLGIGYEDYTDDAELTGTLPNLPGYAIYAGEGKAIYTNTGKALGFY